MSNPFAEQYVKLSNYELIEILSKRSNYQHLAVDAAQQEIQRRNISTEDYEKELALVKANKEKKLRKLNSIDFDERLKKAVNEINTLQREKPAANRQINIMGFTLSIVYVINFITQYRLIAALLADIKNFDAESAIFLFPFVVTPIAIILFWLKQKMGWLLICFLMSMSGAIILLSVINAVGILTYEVIAVIVLSVIIWQLNKEEIRKVYEVNKNDFLLPMITGFIVAILNFLIV